MKNTEMSPTANIAMKECQNLKKWLKESKNGNEELLKLTDEVSVLIQNIGTHNSN